MEESTEELETFIRSYGLYCPNCHSDNTAFSISQTNEGWYCHECRAWFKREDAYTPTNRPPVLFAYTEEGGHWYRHPDGSTFHLTKGELKQTEDLHIRPEHQMPGYDSISAYGLKKLILEAEDYQKVKTFLSTLTPDQIESLRGAK